MKRLDESLSKRVLTGEVAEIDMSKIRVSESGNIQLKEKPMIKDIPDQEKEIERLNEQRIQKMKVFIVFDNVTGNIMGIYFNHEKAKALCDEMRENRKNYPNENYIVIEREVK